MRLNLALTCCALLLTGCDKKNMLPFGKFSLGSKQIVTVEKLSTHYLVTIDDGSPEEIGKQYGSQIKNTVWTEIVDAYIEQYIDLLTEEGGNGNVLLVEFIKRAKDLLPSLSESHRKELLSFSSSAATIRETESGDGLLSEDEIILFNLFPEVISRFSACHAISTFGSLSNGGNLVGRVLEWPAGEYGEMNYINTVVIRKNIQHPSTLSIGYLGYLPTLTGLNSNGIFTALFDSEFKPSTVTTGKKAFSFDLRSGLENSTTIKEMASVISSPTLKYPFVFNCIIADKSETIAIENASSKGNYGTDIRTSTSTLHSGVNWTFNNAIAMVNSNLLKNHEDNHTKDPNNTNRWNVIQGKLGYAAKDGKVTMDEMKAILTTSDKVDSSEHKTGCLYSSIAQSITVWDAKNKKLQVWFRQPEHLKELPKDPKFEDITMPW